MIDEARICSSDEQAVRYERRARLLTTEVSVNEYADFREGVLQIRNEDRQVGRH